MALLQAVREGEVSLEDALARLRRLPFEDLGFARLDTHRALRAVRRRRCTVPASRRSRSSRSSAGWPSPTRTCSPPAPRRRCTSWRPRRGCASPGIPTARILVANPEPSEGVGLYRRRLGGDLGSRHRGGSGGDRRGAGQPSRAGLRRGRGRAHRLAQHPLLLEANAIVVVAGMEGALASVVGGLVDRPVIAVPTSVGYGVSGGRLRRAPHDAGDVRARDRRW